MISGSVIVPGAMLGRLNSSMLAYDNIILIALAGYIIPYAWLVESRRWNSFVLALY